MLRQLCRRRRSPVWKIDIMAFIVLHFSVTKDTAHTSILEDLLQQIREPNRSVILWLRLSLRRLRCCVLASAF